MQRGDYTLVILKPDCLSRNLVGKVLSRFEDLGLRIRALQRWEFLPRYLVESHYEEHEGRDYFNAIVDAMIAGPALTLVFTGPNALRLAREAAGRYDSPEPGTIRAEFRLDQTRNTVHTSGDEDAADTEVALWFGSLIRDLERDDRTFLATG